MPDGSRGLVLPCTAGSFALPEIGQPLIMTIDRITKGSTVGFVSLYATDGTNPGQLIGYYWPEDTEPIYRRIKLGTQAALVRMRYRKRWLKISSLADPIPLRSRLALTSACAAVQLAKTDPQKAGMMTEQAVALLNEEWRTQHPRESAHVNINGRVYGGNFWPVT
jgi:hypothetical protein